MNGVVLGTDGLVDTLNPFQSGEVIVYGEDESALSVVEILLT